jgi:hypothetical protein
MVPAITTSRNALITLSTGAGTSNPLWLASRKSPSPLPLSAGRSARALSHTLAAESDELGFEDFAVDNGPDRSVTDVAREVAERMGWPLPSMPPATLASSEH